MDFDAALARIDQLLHELTSSVAPGLDDEGEYDEDEQPPTTMALNSWGVVVLFTDMASGDHYLRVLHPPTLPPPFLRGMLWDGAETLGG